MSTKIKLPLVYDNEKCNQFVKRMVKANIPVRDYHGRFSWTGPAVCTNRRKEIYADDIKKAAKMKLQRDEMGLEIIYYPIDRGRLLEDNIEEFYSEDNKN
ncbi:MAG TPA: hypothetical protein VI815_02535 [Candidatus Nanoarchaeia archaeon]|nr:hypothetical protein [Candidatus Nanoarchaeia archaeon]